MSLYLSKEAGALHASPRSSPGLPWRLPQFNAPPPMQPPPTMTTVSAYAPPPPSPWPASARRPGVNEAGAIPYVIPGWEYDTTPVGPQNLPAPPTIQQRLANDPRLIAMANALTEAWNSGKPYVAPPPQWTPAQQAAMAATRAKLLAAANAARAARNGATGAGALLPQSMAMTVDAIHAGKGIRSRNGAWALAAQSRMIPAGSLGEAGDGGIAIGTGTNTTQADLSAAYSSAIANYNALSASIAQHPATDAPTADQQNAALMQAASAVNAASAKINASLGEGQIPIANLVPPTVGFSSEPISGTPATPTATPTTSTPVITTTPLPPAVEPPPTTSTPVPIVNISTPVTTPPASSDHTGTILAAGAGALLAFLYFGRNKRRGR